MLQNDPLRIPPFLFDADLDPAFHFDADPNPGGSGSATLERRVVEYRNEWKCRDILVNSAHSCLSSSLDLHPDIFKNTIKKRQMQRKSYGIVLKTVWYHYHTKKTKLMSSET
jgi:hypothetical protein